MTEHTPRLWHGYHSYGTEQCDALHAAVQKTDQHGESYHTTMMLVLFVPQVVNSLWSIFLHGLRIWNGQSMTSMSIGAHVILSTGVSGVGGLITVFVASSDTNWTWFSFALFFLFNGLLSVYGTDMEALGSAVSTPAAREQGWAVAITRLNHAMIALGLILQRSDHLGTANFLLTSAILLILSVIDVRSSDRPLMGIAAHVLQLVAWILILVTTSFSDVACWLMPYDFDGSWPFLVMSWILVGIEFFILVWAVCYFPRPTRKRSTGHNQIDVWYTLPTPLGALLTIALITTIVTSIVIGTTRSTNAATSVQEQATSKEWLGSPSFASLDCLRTEASAQKNPYSDTGSLSFRNDFNDPIKLYLHETCDYVFGSEGKKEGEWPLPVAKNRDDYVGVHPDCSVNAFEIVLASDSLKKYKLPVDQFKPIGSSYIQGNDNFVLYGKRPDGLPDLCVWRNNKCINAAKQDVTKQLRF